MDFVPFLVQYPKTGFKVIIRKPEQIKTNVEFTVLELNPTLLKVGNIYRTYEGEVVTIVEESTDNHNYECVKGSDGIWRYNRASDMGRTTGTPFDQQPWPTSIVVSEGI